MFNTNGRGGDVVFSNTIYKLLLEKNMNTRELRKKATNLLGKEIPTQKMAQFIYNRKLLGYITLDDEGNNCLTESGIKEAERVANIVADIPEEKRNIIISTKKPIYSDINTEVSVQSILKQLSDVRDKISRISITNVSLDEFTKLINIKNIIDDMLDDKKENTESVDETDSTEES